MALSKKEKELVADISKKYGRILDLKKSPAVLIEILHNYGRVLDNGTGGVSPSSIAGSGPPPPPPSEGGETVQLGDVMKAVLKLQRDVKAISKVLNKLAR